MGRFRTVEETGAPVPFSDAKPYGEPHSIGVQFPGEDEPRVLGEDRTCGRRPPVCVGATNAM